MRSAVRTAVIVRLIATALIGLALFGATPLYAQDWPTKPVRILSGFAAGGIADLAARLLAEYITRTTGQQAVVENRTGASGSLAMDAVAKAAPDGYTLGVPLNSNLVINPFIQKSMPFDALNDMVHVAAILDGPQLIAISAEVPAKTFAEFVALAKAKPGTFAYGSAGVGSLAHLAGDALARQAGIQLVHVPYRGNVQAITDVIGGRIHLVSSSIGTLRAGVDAGKLRLLLASTKIRLAAAPDVPTSAEAGVPGYLMSAWTGVVAPAGTPQLVVGRINALVQNMLKDETARKAILGAGLELMPMSQPEFAGFVRAEYGRWEKIVKDAGVERE